MTQSIITHNLGFPRIGADRELKMAQEAYWRGDITQADLEAIGRELRKTHWQLQADAGLDLIPTGDFAWYDQVLTLSATLGNIPARHRNNSKADAHSHSHSHDDHSTCNHSHGESDVQSFANHACTDIDLDTLFRVARGRAPTGNATTAAMPIQPAP